MKKLLLILLLFSSAISADSIDSTISHINEISKIENQSLSSKMTIQSVLKELDSLKQIGKKEYRFERIKYDSLSQTYKSVQYARMKLELQIDSLTKQSKYDALLIQYDTLSQKAHFFTQQYKEHSPKGWSVALIDSVIVMSDLDSTQTKKRNDLFNKAIATYTAIDSLQESELCLKVNDSIASLLLYKAEEWDKMPVVIKASNKETKQSLRIGIMTELFLVKKQKYYLQAANWYLKNIDYGIIHKLKTPIIDSAMTNYPKYGYLAAEVYREMGEEFMKTPIPAKFIGTEKEEYLKEQRLYKKYEMHDRAQPIVGRTLRTCYSKDIHNQWMEKLKKRVRKIHVHPAGISNSGATVLVYTPKDIEYLEALKEIDNITTVKDGKLVNGLKLSEVLKQLEVLKQRAISRQNDVNSILERVSIDLDIVQKDMKKLNKEIFILGGGDLEDWK